MVAVRVGFDEALAHQIEGGADIRYIQTMLGHEELNSTQIYTQVAINKLKEIVTDPN